LQKKEKKNFSDRREEPGKGGGPAVCAEGKSRGTTTLEENIEIPLEGGREEDKLLLANALGLVFCAGAGSCEAGGEGGGYLGGRYVVGERWLCSWRLFTKGGEPGEMG